MFLRQRRYEDEPVSTAWQEMESFHHLYSWRESNPERLPDRCLYIGISGDLVFSEPNTNLLVLGPSQGGGKTSGNIVAQALCARGPIVVTSSKGDIIAPIVMARSLLGEVWHYAPDGEPTPPGMKRLRWSPIWACRSWDVARKTGLAMVGAVRRPGSHPSENSDFFNDKAADLLACILFYAAIRDLGMDFAFAMVANPRFTGRGKFTLGDVMADLEASEHYSPLEILAGLVNADERLRSSVFSTAARAVQAYGSSSVMATTEDPNFDVHEFVAGVTDIARPSMNWDGDCQLLGRYDTVFITAAEQEHMAPVIAGFLSQLRNERRRLFRQDHDPDNPWAKNHRPPLTFVLDELATMAPLHDLPKQLAIGNEGCITVGVLQDLSQAKEIWGPDLGRGMLTMFQNIIVFRGIRDHETLQAISDMAGRHWVEVYGSTEGTSTQGLLSPINESSGTSVSQQLIPRLPIDRIALGHPKYPDGVLWLQPGGGWKWVHNAPYFRSRPWTPVLVQTMEDITQLPIADPRRLLRMPRLFDGLSGRTYGLGEWEHRYFAARQVLLATKAETQRLVAEAEARRAQMLAGLDRMIADTAKEGDA
jgi:hypothetical protein